MSDTSMENVFNTLSLLASASPQDFLDFMQYQLSSQGVVVHQAVDGSFLRINDCLAARPLPSSTATAVVNPAIVPVGIASAAATAATALNPTMTRVGDVGAAGAAATTAAAADIQVIDISDSDVEVEDEIEDEEEIEEEEEDEIEEEEQEEENDDNDNDQHEEEADEEGESSHDDFFIQDAPPNKPRCNPFGVCLKLDTLEY